MRPKTLEAEKPDFTQCSMACLEKKIMQSTFTKMFIGDRKEWDKLNEKMSLTVFLKVISMI
jgi:hypothetical protein